MSDHEMQPTLVAVPLLFEPLPADVAQLGMRAGFAFGDRVFRVEGGLTWPEYRRYITEHDRIEADRETAGATADREAVRALQARDIELAYSTIVGPLARSNRDLPLTVEYLESSVSPVFAVVLLQHFLLQCDPFYGSALPPHLSSVPSNGQPERETSDAVD